MATVPERVNAFITEKGADICDGCVQRAPGLRQSNQVQQIIAALATTRDFDRERGACALCGGEKTATRRAD